MCYETKIPVAIDPHIVLTIFACVVALGDKNLPDFLLAKNDIMCRFPTCKRVIAITDDSEFKNSVVDDERQPEIAIWSPKPEVLTSPKV